MEYNLCLIGIIVGAVVQVFINLRAISNEEKAKKELKKANEELLALKDRKEIIISILKSRRDISSRTIIVEANELTNWINEKPNSK